MSEAPVFCNQCGQAVNPAASFCPRCAGPLVPGGAGAVISGTGVPASRYGGFWIRFVAYIIDSAVVNIVLTPFVLVIMGGYFAAHHGFNQEQGPDAGFFVMVGLVALISSFGVWLYEALMTSSKKQATLGKMVFRMKVTDRNGARLSFLHATGRFLAKILSGCIFGVGYILAGFTERKQALHDLIAGTLVVRN